MLSSSGVMRCSAGCGAPPTTGELLGDGTPSGLQKESRSRVPRGPVIVADPTRTLSRKLREFALTYVLTRLVFRRRRDCRAISGGGGHPWKAVRLICWFTALVSMQSSST